MVDLLKLFFSSVCTIFFGFQRCVFGFTSYGPGGASGNSYGPNTTPLISRSTESTGSDGGGVTVETNGYNADISPSQKGFRDDSQFIAYYYGIITQDKSATYPIISRVPQIANRLRKMSSSPLRNVKIENKDSALLQSIIDYLKGKKGDSDVNHYQMVYQVWRKQPGVKAARSIILTRTHLLLCDEDLLEARDVKITVLESYTRKELNKAYIEEESPLFITLVFKPSSVFSASKKWRLFIESRDAAAKLLTHCQDMIDDK